jgi:hypothetical protein
MDYFVWLTDNGRHWHPPVRRSGIRRRLAMGVFRTMALSATRIAARLTPAQPSAKFRPSVAVGGRSSRGAIVGAQSAK